MSFFTTGAIDNGARYVVRDSGTGIVVATYDASTDRNGRSLGAERAARHAALLNRTPVDVPLQPVRWTR